MHGGGRHIHTQTHRRETDKKVENETCMHDVKDEEKGKAMGRMIVRNIKNL